MPNSPTACRPRCCSSLRRCRRPSGRCSCSTRCSIFGYDELAEAVGKSQAAVRQIAIRARAHVAARRPRESGLAGRMPTGPRGVPAPHSTPATSSALVDLLAPDVVALGDGGGIKQALPRPMSGIGKVAPLIRIGLPGSRDLGITGGLVTSTAGPPAAPPRRGVDAVLSVRVAGPGIGHLHRPQPGEADQGARDRHLRPLRGVTGNGFWRPERRLPARHVVNR